MIKSHNSLFIMVMGLLIISKYSFSQEQFKVDSATNKSKRITLTDFNQRIDRAIRLLETKHLSQIRDADNVNIMMCLNTIFMNEKIFTAARYEKLIAVSKRINYRYNISKVYPKWLFNRGMGRYYPKLKMELYGTPNMYAILEISKKETN